MVNLQEMRYSSLQRETMDASSGDDERRKLKSSCNPLPSNANAWNVRANEHLLEWMLGAHGVFEQSVGVR